jgi:hypothetical protein
MGIYVGHSPSHATNVSLILNPQTGHVSPHFHVVYNNDFMSVPYLLNATVPPHWVEIAKASLMIKLYTEQQVGTWQMLPELDVEIGDFTPDTSFISRPSSDLEGEDQSCPSEDLDREGEKRIEAVLPVNHDHNNQQVTNRVTFDKSNSRAIKSPTQPVNQDHNNQQVTNQVMFGESNSCAVESPTGPIDLQMPDASGVASGQNFASGAASGQNFASGAVSGHNIASGLAFGHNFASGTASGHNLAFGRNKLFELITAFGHVKLIGHVGHTNGLVNHNSQIQPQLIVVIAKDFKIYCFFQEDCRIICEGVKDRCNGLIRDGGVGYTSIGGSLVKPILIVRINDLNGHTSHNGLIGLVRCCIMGLIDLFALSKHWLNSLVDFLGCNGLIGFIGLGLVGFIGLGLVSLVGLIDRISLVGLIGFSDICGLVDQISLASLSGISGLSGCIGHSGLVGLIGLICLGGCVGLIKLVELIGLGNTRIIGFIGHNGLIGHNDLFGFGLVSHNGLIGIFSLISLGFIGLNCLISFIGHVGLVLGHISLIGLIGLIGSISLVGLISFGLNSLIGKGIIVNSLQFEIEMKQSQHDLFWKESWLWCVRRVCSSLAGLNSVFRNAFQNATQLFFDRIPQMTKYCIMRECENIHSWISLSGDLVFSHQQGICSFKFPKRFLEISSRDLTLFLILII